MQCLLLEFGFLVEGSEFEQYKKKLGARNMWILPMQKKSTREENEEDNSDEEEEKNLWRQHTFSRKKRKHEQDDEWRGEDQDEQGWHLKEVANIDGIFYILVSCISP